MKRIELRRKWKLFSVTFEDDKNIIIKYSIVLQGFCFGNEVSCVIHNESATFFFHKMSYCEPQDSFSVKKKQTNKSRTNPLNKSIDDTSHESPTYLWWYVKMVRTILCQITLSQCLYYNIIKQTIDRAIEFYNQQNYISLRRTRIIFFSFPTVDMLLFSETHSIRYRILIA